jgi:alkylresorcinol/alkylpyrone synthase
LQTECWEAVQQTPQFNDLTLRSRAILKKVLLGKNGVVSRHLSLNTLQEAFDLRPDVLHHRFAQHAPRLAVEAGSQALRQGKLSATEIDALVISTCTGYLCPGLSSFVAESLGLRTDAILLDLVGQGCVAALPNMRTGHMLIASGQCRNVLSVCVEICSAAFYLDNDPGVLISACLFGDAAGAAVLSDQPLEGRATRVPLRSIKWRDAAAVLNPGIRDMLRFENRNGMLRNILGLEVPALAAREARKLFDAALAKGGVRREQISAWIWHAGGRDVLVALQEALELTEAEMCWSAEVLRERGNISSACLYHVLERALQNRAPAGLWWMSSFGAGFSCQGALLEVQ